jgi:hypothetical protein
LGITVVEYLFHKKTVGHFTGGFNAFYGDTGDPEFFHHLKLLMIDSIGDDILVIMLRPECG